MANSLSLSSRALIVIRKEGLLTFLRKAISLSKSRIFQLRFIKYYVYEHHIIERNEADYLPRLKDFSFHVVNSNLQAEEMARAGLDVYSGSKNVREFLNKGAIAFCVFSGNRLCHIGWLAMNEEAKSGFEPWPYHVDFSREGCTGGTRTIPEFEGKGLMTYVYYKRFEYLRQKGIYQSRNIVEVTNTASQKVHAKFSPKKSRGYYLRIAFWEFWREAPL